MSQYNISSATKSNMTSRVEDYVSPAVNLDTASGQKETEWMNSKAAIYWGYFSDNPDLKSAILMKAVWIVGKGWTADARTTAYLNNIRGWGKDTFHDIIFNMIVQSRIHGDSFAEFIKDDENPILNLKPLNPASIKIIVDDRGLIKRYEQVNEIEGLKQIKKFKPEEIFHISHNRLGNQIHGISDISSLEPVLKAEQESFLDIKQISHRNARPLIMFKIKTDVQSKIDEFVKKMDEALNKGENIYIPDDDNTVSYEVVQINPSQVILEWRNDIRNKFYRTIGLPQIVPGAGGQSTESESKVIYFAFEQIVKKEQLFLEQQISAQLNIDVKFTPPTSLMQDLQVDSQKDSGGMGVQLNQANEEEV